MRCPNCGTENAPGARFCSNCGQTLAASEPTQPTGGQPGGSEPTQPVAPQPGSAPTAPVIPGPPSAPHARPAQPGAAPPGGGGIKLTPTMLAIGGAVLVVLVGLLVWALFMRDDDEPVTPLPTPTGEPTSQPQTGTTGTTGPTGATGVVTGSTGTTGATGATSGVFGVSVNLCEDVTQNGDCVNAFPYDPASGWSIPVTAPSFTILIVTENLVVGDVISLDITDRNTGDQYYSTQFDPAPAEVVDFQQWIYWLPLVTPTTGSFPSGSVNEVRFYRNGEQIAFQGSNVYTFGEFGE